MEPRLMLVQHLSESLIEQLHTLFQGEWWSQGRTLEATRRAVAGSKLVFALMTPQEELVAFARVLSDGVYKAFLYDMIVAPEWRGKGMSARLLEGVLSHPDIHDVEHLELYCTDELVPYYERVGFYPAPKSLRLLRREATE
jgi:predicted GNAT family N-acyltransferase